MRRFRPLLSITLGVLLLLGTQLASAQGNSQGKGKGNADKARGFGRSMNIGVGNASDGILGRILADRSIFYTGDPLSISVVFPRGADLITAGVADAYVVIFTPIAPEEDGSGDDDSPDDTSDDSNDDSSDDGNDDSSDDGNDDSSDDGNGDSSDDQTDPDDSSDSDDNGTGEALSDAIVLPISSEASSDGRTLFAIDAVDVSTLPAGTYQLGLVLTNPGGDPLVINDWYGGLLGLVHVRGLTVTDEAVDFDSDGDGEVDDDSDGDGFSDAEDDETGDDSVEDDSSDDDSDT